MTKKNEVCINIGTVPYHFLRSVSCLTCYKKEQKQNIQSSDDRQFDTHSSFIIISSLLINLLAANDDRRPAFFLLNFTISVSLYEWLFMS